MKPELQAEIKRQRVSGRCHRQPEVTTKHGKLKTDRKQVPRKMYVDDLAALDILTEVSSISVILDALIPIACLGGGGQPFQLPSQHEKKYTLFKM